MTIVTIDYIVSIKYCIVLFRNHVFKLQNHITDRGCQYRSSSGSARPLAFLILILFFSNFLGTSLKYTCKYYQSLHRVI